MGLFSMLTQFPEYASPNEIPTMSSCSLFSTIFRTSHLHGHLSSPWTAIPSGITTRS